MALRVCGCVSGWVGFCEYVCIGASMCKFVCRYIDLYRDVYMFVDVCRDVCVVCGGMFYFGGSESVYLW